MARTAKSNDLAETNCLQIRETMDALVYGRMRLEQADLVVKLTFLRHLETCSACCRSLDVRLGAFYGGGRRSLL